MLPSALPLTAALGALVRSPLPSDHTTLELTFLLHLGTWDWTGLTVTGGKAGKIYNYAGIKSGKY